MDTLLDYSLARGYKSKSQIARVLTESWTEENMYCPVCGWPTINKFPNNRAVADFYCPNCRNEFEQKSKNGAFGAKIADGAYSTFIQRIIEDNLFTLEMVYHFEEDLAAKHPNNHNVRAKIRQQLQQLRDRGIITFLGDGHYRKNV